MRDICKNCKCCSTEWVECSQCEDGYVEEDFGDDVVPDYRLRPCGLCNGEGGWEQCINPTCMDDGHN